MKVQGFDFLAECREGKSNPTDYNSRNALKNKVPEIEDEDDDEEFYLNAIIDAQLLHAITLEIIRKATNESQTMAQLKYCILNKEYLPDTPNLRPYKDIFRELSVPKELVLRGRRIVVPESLRQDIVALAHIGHQGATKTKQYLHERVWFPKMDAMVEEHVKACKPCLAVTPGENYQPLQPNTIPDRPWQHVATDFKGPVGNQFYLLLVIDEYSRFPVVEIETTTAADKVLPLFDNIIATHAIPEKVKSDNGPPFNGEDMRMYAQQCGFCHKKITPAQPSSNGLAENFMKMLLKVGHTAYSEKKDPRQEVYKYLLSYRATPHSTTGKTPAELLFSRKLRTPVPILFPRCRTDQFVKRHDAQKKNRKKEYHDKKRDAKTTVIKVGDQVLVKQKKTTVKPFYDSKPYRVISVKGTMVTAARNNKSITRNVSKFRKIPQITPSVPREDQEIQFNGMFPLFGQGSVEVEMESPVELPESSNSNMNTNENLEQGPELRRSGRERRKPQYLQDYVRE